MPEEWESTRPEQYKQPEEAVITWRSFQIVCGALVLLIGVCLVFLGSGVPRWLALGQSLVGAAMLVQAIHSKPGGGRVE